MSPSTIREEEVYTDPDLIIKLREKLVSFLTQIPGTLNQEGDESRVASIGKDCVCSGGTGWEPERVAVVDGGGNVMALNAGYIGIAAALGILIEGRRVRKREVSEPEIVPPTPSELSYYEAYDQVKSVVDKLREAMVFETAYNLLDEEPDLLIIDGALIPYHALVKPVAGTRLELEAFERYRSAVLRLHASAEKRGVRLIGVVKRPRSKYLSHWLGVDGFDHVVLSRLLDEGEYSPAPPKEPPRVQEALHEDLYRIVAATRPRFTFLRTSPSQPPYRVDFSHNTADLYKEILAYLYKTRTREGIPYPLMKVDEEVKITNRLLRELYEDALHDAINKYIEQGFNAIIPVLPEYGGV